MRGIKLNIDDVIERFKFIHNNEYGYCNITSYKNKTEKLEIVCKQHGSFFQSAHSHWNGSGCPKCSNSKISKSKEYTQEEALNKFRSVHQDIYDYSAVTYNGCGNHIYVICKKHGTFKVRPCDHWNGRGCPKCGRLKAAESTKLSFDEVIEKFKLKHGNLYDYSNVVYKDCATKVQIKCNKHNIMFSQMPYNHWNGQGCPLCGQEAQSSHSKSIWETELSKELKRHIDIKTNNRTLLKGLGPNGGDLELDMVFNNKAIECNGTYWHCDNRIYKEDFVGPYGKLAKDIWKYDNEKIEKAKAVGIDVLTVWENDYKNYKVDVIEKCLEFLR